MATVEQFAELTRYVETLSEEERTRLSVDEIYGRWRTETVSQEDLKAIKESLEDYRNGERGRPIEDFLAELYAESESDI